MKIADYTGISPDVRKRVYERDSWDGCPCCIVCGKPQVELAHYVARSHLGLGIEENLICLCHHCHYEMDNYTDEGKKIKDMARLYLETHYQDWNEKELKINDKN